MKLDERLKKYINQLDRDMEAITNDRFNETKESDIQILKDVQDDLNEILEEGKAWC